MKWNFPFVPEQATRLSAEHDRVFFWILGLAVFFTVIVSAIVVAFAIRYRHGSKVDRSNISHHNTTLEIAWSMPPLFLGLLTFYFGAQLYVRQRIPPKDCYEVYVIGKQWMWHMQHPNGVRENNTLHIPVGKPVKVTMISQDVIHAFYIPEFRTQYYTVPGRYTSLWFNADHAGTYHLFCNLYCGTQHSEMGGTIVAMPQKDFNKWLQNGGENGMAEKLEDQGAKLFSRYACNNCHTNIDTERGPTLNNVAGNSRTMMDGKQIVADQEYLRDAILHPNDKLTKGYPYRTMPDYAGQITEEDVLALSAYIRTLSLTTAAAGQPVNTVQTGSVDTKPLTATAPTMAVNATGTENYAKAPAVKANSLAVGALATEHGDQYKNR